MSSRTAVLDFGAYNNKLGLNTDERPRIIPNYISKAKNERRKVFIGDQLNECKDFSGFFYVLPFQKGYLVNWDVQRQLFDYMFNKDSLKGDVDETHLVITEPQFNFTSIKECLDEILFEEYRFKAVCRITAAQLAARQRKQEEEASKKHLCCLVVDSGFSFTHVVPICNGKILKKAVRRIDVGGKLLTNHLKEIISYRQLHVLDETYVMNQVKEDCCFVSNDFMADIEITKKKKTLNTIARDYILPDYTNVKRGFIRPLDEMWKKYTGTEQLLRVNNERFTVPETLFHPSDIGIQQMGIPETIFHSINQTPVCMQPHFYMNIVLTGGNTCLPGYRKRVYDDVRSLAPVDFDVNVHASDSPMTYSWEGGVSLSKHEQFLTNFCVTRQEYEESGRAICSQKFEGGVPG
ncbi:actin-related protein 6-like [Hydractinia symbiolongicarpus]|uniref:actin-related protein 6-like n=1 Tax=Hydractinia symbiolongicarpus TaxID=13093 RepID=UPI00254AE571|nr:actin-related protein 6-like [Hydractinia symbiolongicarpus]